MAESPSCSVPELARLVRAVLRQVLLGAGPAPADVGVEVFPKQEQPGPRGLSSLVKLPLGVHRKTLARAHLLDDDLQPVVDVAAALAALRPVDERVADAVAGGRVGSTCCTPTAPARSACWTSTLPPTRWPACTPAGAAMRRCCCKRRLRASCAACAHRQRGWAAGSSSLG